MVELPDAIVGHTESFIVQLIDSINDGSSLKEDSNVIINGVKELAKEYSKEKQHAAAARLHVNQLEKLITRLRNEKEINGSSGRNTPLASSVYESELQSVKEELQAARSEITNLSTLVNEKEELLFEFQNELSNKTNELDTSYQALVTIQENNATADSAIETLDSKLQEAVDANQLLLDEISRLKSENEVLHDGIVEKQKDMDALTETSVLDSETYFDVVKQFCALLSSDMEMFANHVSQSLNSIDAENSRITNIHQTLKVIQISLSDRDEELKKLQSLLRQSEDAYNSVYMELSKSKQTFEAEISAMSEKATLSPQLEQEVNMLRLKNEELQSSLASKESEILQSQEKLENSAANVKILTEGFETLSEQVERYKALSEQLKTELTEQQSMTDLSQELHGNLKLAEEKLAYYEQQVKEATSNLENFRNLEQRRIADYEQTIKDQSNEINSLKQSHEEEMVRLQEELQTFTLRINEMDLLLPQLHEQLTAAHKAKLNALSECEELKKAIDISETKVSVITAELDKVNETKQIEESNLRSKNEMLAQQLVERNSEIDELASKIDDLESELKTSNEESGGSQSTKNQLNEALESIRSKSVEVEELHWKLGRSTDEVERLEFELENVRATTASEIDDLNNMLKNIRTVNDQLNGQLQSLLDEVDSLKDESKKLGEQNLQLHTDIDNFKRENEDLTRQVNFQTSEVTRLTSLLEQNSNASTGEVSELMQQLQQESRQTAELSRINALLKDQLQSLSNKISEDEVDKSSLLNRCQHYESELNQFQTNNEQLNVALSSASANVEQLNQEKSALTYRCSEYEEKISKLVKESATSDLKVKELTQMLTKSEGDKEQLSRLESEKLSLLEQNGLYETELGNVKQICAKLSQQLESIESGSSDEIREWQHRFDIESQKVRELELLNSRLDEVIKQDEQDRHELMEKNQLYESEFSKLTTITYQFSQYIDSLFSELWAKINGLSQKLAGLAGANLSLVDFNRTLLAGLQQVKEIVSSYPRHIEQSMSSVLPALKKLECRIDVCQGVFLHFSNLQSTRIAKVSSESVSCQTAIGIKEIEYLEATIEDKNKDISKITGEKNSEISTLRHELSTRDEQLEVFNAEMKRLVNENQHYAMLEHENQLKQSSSQVETSEDAVQTVEEVASLLEFEELQAALSETQGNLNFCEEQLQSANKLIQDLKSEMKSHKSDAKRAERRFLEADIAFKSMAQDSRNMAAIVASLREQLASAEQKLAATESARAQIATQLQTVQTSLENVQPNIEQNQEIAEECDRLRNKVKFMTDQFELAVSRSALLERSLHEKEQQCERLARELGSERQRLLTFEGDSPSRESSPALNANRVDLKQYYNALPVPFRRAVDRVRHSRAANATMSASQRFQSIVSQSPIGNTVNNISIRARHFTSRLSPAKVQLAVTIYVCFLHLMTLFYMFTCSSSSGQTTYLSDSANEPPPHMEKEPEDM